MSLRRKTGVSAGRPRQAHRSPGPRANVDCLPTVARLVGLSLLVILIASPVEAQSDLSLTKTVDNHTPDVGSTVTFTLTLTNNGPEQATHITITDVVPIGLGYVASSITGGDSRDDSDPTVSGLSWTGNSLNNGTNTTLTFQATPGIGGLPITNIAEVTAVDQADPDSTPGNGDSSEDDYGSVTMIPLDGAGTCPAPSLIFSDGFESGDLLLWDGSVTATAGDSIIASTDQANTGTYSAKAETDAVHSHRAYVFKNFAGETTVSAIARIYLESGFPPNNFTEFLYLKENAAVSDILATQVNDDMTLSVWNAVAGEEYFTSATLSTGVWHTLLMTAVINGANSEARLWLDRKLVVNQTGINLGAKPIGYFSTGHYFSSDPNPASILYVDDATLCAEELAPTTVNYRSIGTVTNYTTGTIDATEGSAVVDGTGTSWQTANRGCGDRIQINGTDYTILSIDSETQLTLTVPVSGSYTGIYTISRQFLTLQACETCISGGGGCTYFPVVGGNLVADDRKEIGIAYNDSIVPTDPDFTAQVLFDGSITDNTHTITLTADDSNRHYGAVGNGVVVDMGASTNAAIRLQDDWVNVEWLEIRGGSGSTARGVQVDTITAGTRTIVRNLLIHDMPGQGIRLDDPDVDIDIYNNIIYEVAVGIRPTSASANARIINNKSFELSNQLSTTRMVSYSVCSLGSSTRKRSASGENVVVSEAWLA